MTFTQAKKSFNELYENKKTLDKSIVKSAGNDLTDISIKDKNKQVVPVVWTGNPVL